MAEKVTVYALDACALIAYLREEEGNDKLKNLLKARNNKFLMHAVNLGEVYYDTLRVSGKDKAQELFKDISELPIAVIWGLDALMIELAGHYKTSYRISYADSFVLALAERENATLISTDHHEFDEIDSSGELQFYWLR